jgi:hypothetical protein
MLKGKARLTKKKKGSTFKFLNKLFMFSSSQGDTDVVGSLKI